MSQRTAFSLVELSIVLVILGLLTGGILAGQSLIRASELRAVTTEANHYMTARNSFRDKYLVLPGDMANAYAFWNTACGTNTTTISTGCNGDGDGRIEALNVGENIKAWEHLSRAGLIAGSYDGTGANNGVNIDVTPTNVAKSKFPQGFWDITDQIGNCASNGTAFCPPAALNFGTASVSGNSDMQASVNLTHAEAWNIDTKTDDGRANTGKVRGSLIADCYDQGTDDYYAFQAVGADTVGDCTLYFLLE